MELIEFRELYLTDYHLVPADRPERKPLCLQPVIDYIRANYAQSIPVSQLSQLIHVCDDHLIRLFKTATNKTPTGYLLDVRLEEAMKLLVKTELSATEIAARCGFSNSCYMARVFKNRLHKTPMEYRETKL